LAKKKANSANQRMLLTAFASAASIAIAIAIHAVPACHRVRGQATPAVGDIICTSSAAGACTATGFVAA
jgi:hypothetical protein